ncbi:alpha-mannosidase [Neobacillus kokaensis]|uniref:alpha-mannosidase n=1 Tax=Neobacillus kokaensis TaxID=2759023 RepID=UPI0017498B0A|nr:alpha-mannosidase [Neobacillus kokaensis]
MFWTEKKLESRIKELEKYRYRDCISIPEFNYQLDQSEGVVVPSPPANKEWSKIRLGDHWTGRDLYAWLQTNIQIPGDWAGRTVVGIFDFGKTGDGNNSGFESLLYINGAPYQGVDSNHQESFLPDSLIGSKVELTLRLWSGLEGGGVPAPQEHKIKRAEIAWLDEKVDDLYYTSAAMLKAVHVLNDQAPERQALLAALDRSFLLLDWSKPGSEGFYQSAARAQELLEKELQEMKSHHPVTVTAIGHTHIDVAWLWRLKHTREKATRSFSTVLRLMERYPDYVFLQTQPQLYDYIKSDFPELYEQIRTRVSEGRWEAGGGMWLEADCNIPSGESLVRQFLMGTRFFREEFGAECRYLWLPDVFGYSWAMPQILKKSGIDTFMTTKISWNQYNRMPHDTFKWRGIDGTEILTHFITTTDTDDDWKHIYTYNGQILPETVLGSWTEYRDKQINKELLLSYGYGDGGGGVNREMLEMRRRLDDMPGLPRVRTGRADDYFKRLQETVEQTDQYVHTWDGELYFEYHRGTYTSQAYNKKMNRKLELLYREVEWLSILEGLFASSLTQYPQSAINEGWKIILRNQFHDIIPGTSIREVYEDSTLEYQEAEKIANELAARSLYALVSDKEYTFTVMNSSSWEKSGLVSIAAEAGMEYGEWKDAGGKTLEACREGENWLVHVNAVPSTGIDTICFEPAEFSSEAASVPFEVLDSGVVTPNYEISWDESGQLTSIFDRGANREVLANGTKGNVLQVFEDKPMHFDAWDIDIYYQEKMQEIKELQSVNVISVNALRLVIEFKWFYLDSTITQKMVLFAKSPRIDFVTTIDWHEQNQLLKAAFPVDVRATEATYDIQFGNIKRPTHWNTSWDMARFETVGHQWADLSERGFGVSILNDCKYGHDIKDNVIRLTLLRSATDPDYLQDQGFHSFTYSLLPHQGDWVDGKTVQEAWDVNQPLTVSKGAAVTSAFSLFRLSVDHVMIDAIKKAEDSEQILLRVHEYTGSRGKVEVQSDLVIHAWQECDLMERPMGTSVRQDRISFDIQPYEIRTFLVDISQK